MEHANSDIIGLEESAKKNKGNAEFSFEAKDLILIDNFMADIIPKKKIHHKTIVKDVRRNKRSTGKGSELF